MLKNAQYDHAFAIVRVDESPRAIVVKKVVWDADEAKKEVARLNKINKGCLYSYQITRVEKHA